MFLELALVDVGGSLEDATGLVQYALVFLFAAIPIVEILVVIPVGIGIGLDPVATGLVAFTGNVLSVYLVILFQHRLIRWWQQRTGESETSSRYTRAQNLWDRYGVPALGFAGPVLTGVHIAAIVALVAGSRPRSVALWMTIGIALWSVVFVIASVAGLSLLGLL